MGRRPEAQRAIVKCLMAGRKRWTELFKESGLGKGPFVKGLNELLKRKVVSYSVDSTKRPAIRYYELNRIPVYSERGRRSLFSMFSMEIFDDLDKVVRNRSHPDREVLKRFCEKIGLLALYTFLLGLSVKEPEEADKWIKEGFTTVAQKFQILSMLIGRICYGPMKFEKPVDIKETVRRAVEWHKDEGIYISYTTVEDLFLNPTLMELVMKHLPNGRIEELKNTLRELYPQDIELLDRLSSIDVLFDKFIGWAFQKKQL